jgi:putative SOS response-associated peptidase YedK
MCGRFGLLSPSEISERFALVAQLSFDARYNAAPTQVMPVVTEDGTRMVEGMRWGYESPVAEREARWQTAHQCPRGQAGHRPYLP